VFGASFHLPTHGVVRIQHGGDVGTAGAEVVDRVRVGSVATAAPVGEFLAGVVELIQREPSQIAEAWEWVGTSCCRLLLRSLVATSVY